MNGEKFNSNRAPVAVGLYPHARKVDNLLFLSGVGPRKVAQNDIPGVILNENGKCLNDICDEVACRVGFRGDGHHCWDINECAEGTKDANHNID